MNRWVKKTDGRFSIPRKSDGKIYDARIFISALWTDFYFPEYFFPPKNRGTSLLLAERISEFHFYCLTIKKCIRKKFPSRKLRDVKIGEQRRKTCFPCGPFTVPWIFSLFEMMENSNYNGNNKAPLYNYSRDNWLVRFFTEDCQLNNKKRIFIKLYT